MFGIAFSPLMIAVNLNAVLAVVVLFGAGIATGAALSSWRRRRGKR